MSDLEKFLRGEALTPELEALKNGPPEASKRENGPETVAGLPVTDIDVKYLKQLRGYPGWTLLVQLLDYRIEQLRQNAIALSENDPVGLKEELSRAWLYVNAWKGVRAQLDGLIDEAIQVMETKEGDEKRVD